MDNIVRPNIKIEDMFKSVRNDVVLLSDSEQVPWENTSLNKDFYFNTMSQDEIDEQIYQSIRNNYAAETLVLLSRMTDYSISDLLRIHTKQKSEKPGGIYFKRKAELEQYILEQALELGFVMNNYRWCYKGVPVHMGEFFHNPDVKLRNM